MPHAEAPRVISVQRMKQPLRAVLVARPAVQEMAIPSPNQNPPPVARLAVRWKRVTQNRDLRCRRRVAVQETNSKKRR